MVERHQWDVTRERGICVGLRALPLSSGATWNVRVIVVLMDRVYGLRRVDDRNAQ
jgi:hypothetical protein